MNILVINSGSSSIKYQLFQTPSFTSICNGLVEQIGLKNSVITHQVKVGDEDKVIKQEMELKDHAAAMAKVCELLLDAKIGVIKNPDEIDCVGHRVVHGGDIFSDTTLITEKVKEEIKKLFPMAPLHNPGEYLGITLAEKIFTKAKQVVVFDTAFHQTLPAKAFRMALPNSFYEKNKIRVFGFHGTSHKYVTSKALNYLAKPDAKIVTLHLGNGCSMAAVNGGKCIDTSMGFTPLAGLIMGSRCGDIDPSVVIYILSDLGYTAKEVDHILNKESGMLGLTGNSDMRAVKKMLLAGDERAKLAYEMYAYRIQKYIGAYAAALNGLDALVFTGGVGENDTLTRELVCTNMEFLGIQLNQEKNLKTHSGINEINAENSRAKVLIVPTNEELEIAQQCLHLIKS
jgi:acetate kinase